MYSFKQLSRNEAICYNVAVELCGAVVQLGEHYTGSVDVRGSSPLGSTIFNGILPLLAPCKVQHKAGGLIDSA